MLEASEQPEQSLGQRRWLRRIALGVELAGFLALIVLYNQVLDLRRNMGCGEQCAWKAMGLMLILSVGAWVVIPGAAAALYFGGSIYALAALIFLGWSASGTLPLLMGTIPSETIPARYLATAIGMVVGLEGVRHLSR